MHELSVVFYIIKDVNKIASEQNVTKVNSVTIELGEVSTVVPELFIDCWDWAVKKETILKDAKIKIERLEAITHCNNCNKDYKTITFGKKCPYCESDDTYLLKGNEMIIKEIEVSD